MAETILTPGKNNISEKEAVPSSNPEYLLKDKLLSGFTEAEQSTIRANIGAATADDVYSKAKVEELIQDKITDRLNEHKDSISNSYINNDTLTTKLGEYVRQDGSVPFMNTQKGVTPKEDSDLTTKFYVDSQVNDCLKRSHKQTILEEVDKKLKNYIKEEEVYSKDEVYTKKEVDSQNSNYVKLDGSVAFRNPQSGKTPQIGSHLTTKNYVDTLLNTHKSEADPHNLIERLNTKLKKYALKDNVLDITQTYSRSQINSIVDKLVSESVQEHLKLHNDLYDPHDTIEKVKELGYIKEDNLKDLVTLKQLDEVKQTLQKNLDQKQCEWITSGPAEATVGNVSIDTDLPETMSVQEILDAIFYGRGVSLHVPEYNNIATECKVKVCIHGTIGLVEFAELYQGNTLIASFTKDDFTSDRCVTIMSEPLTEDTDFTFRVTYINGAVHEETKIVKCSMPIFIGLLPKWKFGNTITYEYLQEQAAADDTNNKFYHEGGDEIIITHKYNFTDKSLMHLMAVVPESYPDLYQMRIPSQQFEKEAFDIIDMIPFRIPGVEKDIIYKIYIYRQALYTAKQETTFKFKNYE